MKKALVVIGLLCYAFRSSLRAAFGCVFAALHKCQHCAEAVLEADRRFVSGILKGNYDSSVWLSADAGWMLLTVIALALLAWWALRSFHLWMSRRFASRIGAKGFDDPIAEESEDRLGRGEYVASLYHLITSAQDGTSQVVGIYGEWGEGKTSVVQLLQSKCRNTKSCRLRFTWFNPWSSVARKNIQAEFFKSIGYRLGCCANPVLGFYFLRYACQKAESLIPQPHGLCEWVLVAAAKIFNLFSSLDGLKRELCCALARVPGRIVVVLDDLDRIEQDELREIIRCVKTNGDLPNVTYLLLADEDRLACATAELYGDGASDVKERRRFLEKIVQYPFPLWVVPADCLKDEASRLLANCLVRNHLNELELEDRDIQFCLEKFSTLRQIKRLVLTYEANLAYYRAAASPGMTLNLHLGDALRLTALRMEIPHAVSRFYSFYTDWYVTSDNLLYTFGVEKNQETYDEICRMAPESHRAWFEEFLKETMMISVKQDGHGQSYKPDGFGDGAAKISFRLASPSHFERYFHRFDLSPALVPKEVFEEFVAVIQEPNLFPAWFENTSQRIGMLVFLRQLLSWEYSLNAISLKGLGTFLCGLTDAISRDESRRTEERACLVDLAYNLYEHYLGRCKFRKQISQNEFNELADYVISNENCLVAEFIVLASTGLVEPRIEADPSRCSIESLEKTWFWLKDRLSLKIFSDEIERRLDFDPVARYYNLILFRRCAIDGGFFLDHIQYLKKSMEFPRIINRIKTLGMYVGVGPSEACGWRLVFKEAMGQYYTQYAVEIVAEAERVFVEHFNEISHSDHQLIRMFRVGFQSDSSSKLDELLQRAYDEDLKREGLKT